MLKLQLRGETDESIYLVDDEGKPIAKIQVLERRGNQVGIGITARRETKILRNKLVESEKIMEYDAYLRG